MFGHGIKEGQIMDEISTITIDTYHANKLNSKLMLNSLKISQENV